MKKIIVLILSVMLLAGLTGCKKEAPAAVSGADVTATDVVAGDTVYVTIANGDLQIAAEAVPLTDTDSDGKLTVADALFAAHEKKFDGGASAGFGDAMTDYGLSLTKLWGVENGGAYGYYVNNASAMSLTDELKNGDSVCAFIYQDTTAWSDAYTYFDNVTYTDGTVTLTLEALGFDESFAPVSAPLEGAVITVNGEKSDIVTAADGSASVSAAEGDIISALYDNGVIVPPVCVVG